MQRPVCQFVIDRLDVQGQPILLLIGDMDRYAGNALDERLRLAITQGHRLVSLDLSAVRRIDSRGLASLVAAYEKMRAARRQLHIVAASEAVREMLATHRLEHMLLENPHALAAS